MRPANPRPPRESDRPLHRFLVLSDAPRHWPPAAPAGLLAALGAVSALAWYATAGPRTALAVGALFILAALLDAAILGALPRLRISFGPVSPQLVTLAVPRFAASLLCAPLAMLLPGSRALALLFLAQAAGTLLLAWGALWEAWALGVTRLEAPIPAPTSVSHGKAGLDVLHISDIHMERWGRREERLARLAQELQPDLILLTGDYTSLSFPDDERTRRDARRMLAALEAPLGVYAVLGSPDVDHNSGELFQGLSIRLLRDEAVTLDTPLGGRITLIGMECTEDRDHDAQRLLSLASGLAPGDYRILLYHSPESALVASDAGIDLYLCGHTHGGQIRLPLYGALVTSSNLGKRFEAGRYRIGKTTLYVSRGVGLEGLGAPRVRLLCRPETTLITLKSAGPAG